MVQGQEHHSVEAGSRYDQAPASRFRSSLFNHSETELIRTGHQANQGCHPRDSSFGSRKRKAAQAKQAIESIRQPTIAIGTQNGRPSRMITLSRR